MKKAEGAALANLLSVVEHILEKSGKGEPIELDRFEQTQLRDAFGGVMAIIKGHRAAAQEKLAENDLWMKLISNRNYQLSLVDEKGNALEEPKPRTIMDDIDSGKWANEHTGILDGVHREDGEQLPITEEAEAEAGDAPEDGETEDEPEQVEETFEENGVTAQWALPKGVPQKVMAGLIQAVRDGATRTRACELVAKEVALTAFEVKAHFETLQKEGIFVLEGKNWIAHMPTERPPSAASVG